MSSALSIPYTFYPHIVEAVVDYADHKTRLRCRATSQTLKSYVNALLLANAVVVEPEDGMEGYLMSPYTGSEYPFFKLEGDRAAQGRLIQDSVLTAENVKPSPSNDGLINRARMLMMPKHHPPSNYQLGAFNPLYLQITWDCDCSRGGDIHPPFRHTAQSLIIMIYGRNQLVIEASSTNCHILQHILNDGVRVLDVHVATRLSIDAFKNFAALCFPNARNVTLDADFYCCFTFELDAPPTEQLREEGRAAIARHLRVSQEAVEVSFNDEDFA